MEDSILSGSDLNDIWDNKDKFNEAYYFELLIYNIVFIGENIIIKFICYNNIHYIIGLTLNIITIYTIVKTYINYLNKNNNYKKDVKTLKENATLKIKDIEKDIFKLEESTLALDNWIYEV